MAISANIHIVHKDGGIYFYSHLDGGRIPKLVAMALDRGRNRWNDEQYLARIIFSEMVKDDVMGLTNYGIGVTPCEETIMDIDMPNQEVHLRKTGEVWNYDNFIVKYRD